MHSLSLMITKEKKHGRYVYYKKIHSLDVEGHANLTLIDQTNDYPSWKYRARPTTDTETVKALLEKPQAGG
jgi:hypothetical protein